jgi:hypothetical protein
MNSEIPTKEVDKEQLPETQILTSLPVTKTNFKKQKKKHVRPETRADALFNFTKQLEWLLWTIDNKRLSPRYNIENVAYLHMKGIQRIAYPMKCFCDINLHQIKDHLKWYGYYGIAFNKEWGMKQKIQPVQYINDVSLLANDFSDAFNQALGRKTPSKVDKYLKSYLSHELLYFKPYSGHMAHHPSIIKCFTDESEWRYIPNITISGIPQVIRERELLNEGFLLFANRALQAEESASLKFEYSDIKYIVIKSQGDFDELIDVIHKLEINQYAKYSLSSKILVWDSSKGDF